MTRFDLSLGIVGILRNLKISKSSFIFPDFVIKDQFYLFIPVFKSCSAIFYEESELET